MAMMKTGADQEGKAPMIVELNSAFTQSEAKRQIVCPPDLAVTPKEFYEAFAAQLAHNRLPARATLQQVSWDHGQRPQEMILVAFTGDEAPTDIVRLVVGFKQMGNFVYVERMLTFLPPSLPKVRNRREPLRLKEANSDIIADLGCGVLGIAGGILLLLGIIIANLSGGDAGVCVVPGIILIAITIAIVSGDRSRKANIEKENAEITAQNQEIAAWNQLAENEEKRLSVVVDRWSTKIGQYFYLSQIDDVFGRWISAISLTLDQVIKHLFVGRQAQADAWDIQQKTQQEIEQQMQKLRENAMK